MKRYIHSSEIEYSTFNLADILDKIVSITYVDDIDKISPKDSYVYGSSKIDYSKMTREQLLGLPKRTLENIRDIKALRKLKRDELTTMQYMLVFNANQGEQIQSSKKDVKAVLDAMKNCHVFRVWGTEKNNTFYDMIWNKGCELTQKDVRNIIHDLAPSDYSHSKLSTVDDRWNELLMVFGYSQPYTFEPRDSSFEPFTTTGIEIYIKLDVNSETGDGYVVLSFHESEYSMNHPYN